MTDENDSTVGAAFLRGEHALAQLIRFALVGGLSNIGYLLPFLALYGGGPQLANLAGSLVSTVLANELHRRLTFRASGRVRWYTAQLEGGALALTGLVMTSAAIAALEWTTPSMDGLAQAAAVLAITAAVGVFRFLTLRRWVFRSPPWVGDGSTPRPRVGPSDGFDRPGQRREFRS